MVGRQSHAPAAFSPGKNRYKGRSGRVRKIEPPPAFDLRTVQPVASRYTDCAVPAYLLIKETHKNWRLEERSCSNRDRRRDCERDCTLAVQVNCILLSKKSVCRFTIQATLDRLEPEVHLSDVSNTDPVMSASSNSAR